MEIPFVPLEGRFILLEPMTPALKEPLRAAIDCDPETWAILPNNAMGAHFETYWAGCFDPLRLAYAVRFREGGRIVGTSSYFSARTSPGAIEIGATFFHPDMRSGVVNPEAKLLMLAHAFSSGLHRVEFHVDTRNQRSQGAMTKLGAVKEGVLRKNRSTWTGYVRDTAIFSVLDSEWPRVRDGLEHRLKAR
jgi:RimJ/RimL family protein N-acetyltransferase